MANDRPWPGPPTGVSTNQHGVRTPIAAEAAQAAPPRKRPFDRNADPLGDPSRFRVVEQTAPGPAGTNQLARDVRTGPMPKTRRPKRNMTSFTSVDGKTYTIRTRDAKGKVLPHRNEQALFLALTEMMKGGDASTVLDAYKLNLKDEDGQQIYPFPPDVLASIGGVPDVVEEVDEEAMEESGFKLGE
jgi:hypothetical protein